MRYRMTLAMTTLASRNQSEAITEAFQLASKLFNAVREARAACESDPILGPKMKDIALDAAKILNELGEIEHPNRNQ